MLPGTLGVPCGETTDDVCRAAHHPALRGGAEHASVRHMQGKAVGQPGREIPAFLLALDRVWKAPFLVIVPLPGKGNPVHLSH